MMLLAQGLFIGFCLLANGFFAGMETGVISMNRLRLRHQVRHQVRGARILQEFLADPDHLLGTTLVGTNLFMVLASVAGTSVATRIFGTWGTLVASVVMSVLVLVFCEYMPKAWFRAEPTARSRPFAPLLKVAGVLLYPASKLVLFAARLLVPAPRPESPAGATFITKEELMHLASEGRMSGELSEGEHRMIHAVFELTYKTCSDLMIPRSKFVQVSDQASREDLLRLARTRELSRLPVYAPGTDRFTGVLNIMDVLRDPHGTGKTAAHYQRPPQYMAADVPADELLARMRRARQPLVLVTDKHGRVVGLVTIELVLEEVVAHI